MQRRMFLAAAPMLALMGTQAGALESSTGTLRVTEMAAGLDTPWAFGFLPDSSVLITERDGRVMRLSDGRLRNVAGVGEVAARGQGGLLDLLMPRDFATTRTLFFSFAKRQQGGAGTAVARAQLSSDMTRLSDWQVIFEMTPGSSGGRHFGSRIVEGRDGLLYVTTGDRGDRPSAQDCLVRAGRSSGLPATAACPPTTRSRKPTAPSPKSGHGATATRKGRRWTSMGTCGWSSTARAAATR